MDEQLKGAFGQYGKHFQEKILQALLVDRKFAEQMMESFNPESFELKYLQWLGERYYKYWQKYKDFPTTNLLVSIVKDELKANLDATLREQVIAYLQKIKLNPDLGDLVHVKEKTLDFCKRQALKTALEKSVDLIATEKYDSVVDVIKKAVLVGDAPSIGHDFFKDQEARFQQVNRSAILTGFSQLDGKGILNGGLGRGELGVFMMATGCGKSHWLVQMGCSALREGKNVLHYTFELSECQIGIRYDSNLCDIAADDVPEFKDEVLKKYVNSNYGRLFIKEYPTNFATVATLKSHIDKLAAKEGFIPDMLIIDYVDNMKSGRQSDTTRDKLKSLYEEVRDFAKELGVPCWTASQTNRDGIDEDIITLDKIAEAYAKAMVADVIITMSRKSSEKMNGYGKLFIAKNRAGRDGLVFIASIDTSRSMFSLLGEDRNAFQKNSEEEDDIKKALKARWHELKNDSSIKLVDVKQYKKTEEEQLAAQ